MDIKYKNTYLDVFRLMWNSYSRDPIYVGCTVLFSIWFSYYSLHNGITESDRIFVFVIVFIATIVSFSFFGLILALLSAILTGEIKRMASKTLKLNDDGFTSENEYEKTEYKWDVVHKVKNTRKFIYIFVSKTVAYAIPKRAFQGNDDWQKFYLFCDSKVGKNNN